MTNLYLHFTDIYQMTCAGISLSLTFNADVDAAEPGEAESQLEMKTSSVSH